MIKAYKRYGIAKENSNGQPILRVGTGAGTLYITGLDSIDEICILANDGKGSITGNITMKHLDRLGNGNHATAKDGKNYSHGRAYHEVL